MPHATCPMPHAACPIPHAPCPMPHRQHDLLLYSTLEQEPTSPAREGPLFPETASQETVRAVRPSAGEASGTSTAFPQMAAHERARAPPQKKPTKGVRPPTGGHVRGPGHHQRTTPQTNVPLSKRISDNPGQTFVEMPRGTLFFRCCEKTLQNIAETIKIHRNSNDHCTKLASSLERNDDDEAVLKFLHEYYANHPNEAMAGVSKADQLYRYRVVESMLSAGVPISKVDNLRPLLERAQSSLTDSRHLKVFIPKIETREVEQLIEEVADQRVTIIFDGTSRLGEALVLILRWIPADFSKVEQRLVAFRTTFAHTNGTELAQLIMSVLLTTMKLQPNSIVGGARDSCSTNGVAMRILKGILVNMQEC